MFSSTFDMIIIRIDGGCPRPAPTLPPLPLTRQEPSLRSFRVHCILPSATRNQQQSRTKSYLLLGSNNSTNSIKASTSTNINKKINTNNNNTKNQNNNNRELLHCTARRCRNSHSDTNRTVVCGTPPQP